MQIAVGSAQDSEVDLDVAVERLQPSLRRIEAVSDEVLIDASAVAVEVLGDPEVVLTAVLGDPDTQSVGFGLRLLEASASLSDEPIELICRQPAELVSSNHGPALARLDVPLASPLLLEPVGELRSLSWSALPAEVLIDSSILGDHSEGSRSLRSEAELVERHEPLRAADLGGGAFAECDCHGPMLHCDQTESNGCGSGS